MLFTSNASCQGLSLLDLLPNFHSPALIRGSDKSAGLKNLRCSKSWALPACCSSQSRWPKFSYSWLIPFSGSWCEPFPYLQGHITNCDHLTNYHRRRLTVCVGQKSRYWLAGSSPEGLIGWSQGATRLCSFLETVGKHLLWRSLRLLLICLWN